MKKLPLLLLVIVASAGSVVSQPAPVPKPTPDPSPAASPKADNGKPDKTNGTTGAVTIPPEKSAPVTVPRFEKPPLIDGKLDDGVWQNAAVLKDFYQIQPGDNVAPSRPTEVLIGYDPKFLYIAFRVTDEPDKVRATVAKRDNIFNDDYVGFMLDTFNDQRKAFEFFFNPLGIQGDGVLTEGRGEDFSVDVLMDSKGIVHEKGYDVEIAIPFKSLRFEAGKGKLWGAHFFRRIKRFENELDSWMPFSRSISSNLSQAGHLGGLEGISVERTIEIIPSLTLSESGRFVRSYSTTPGIQDIGRIVNEPIRFDPGLTAKFIPSSGMTIDLAINPDFAQVEADQLVVTANQRFPIFYPEKRPFFLEGIDVFRTPITVVHTRAIVDPDIAVKTTGKLGRNTFGLMVASDAGPGTFVGSERLNPGNFPFLDKNAYIGVLRLKRDVGKENSLGMLATSYNFIQKHNQVMSVDGRFRMDQQTTATFNLIGTTSRNFFFNPDEGKTRYRTGNGFGYSLDYNVSGRNWGWELYGEGFTNDYRTDVGFVQRTNSNFSSAYLRYNSEKHPKKTLISYHLHNFTHLDYDWQGRMYIWETEFAAELALPRNSYVGGFWEPAYERLFEHEFGATRTARACNPFGADLNVDPAKRLPACTFFGENTERPTSKNHLSIYWGSNYSKKIQFNGQVTHRTGHLDLDFGNGSKYPRVSPAAISQREAIAAGQCPDPVTKIFDLACGTPGLDPGRGGLWQINGGLTYQPTNELRMSLNLTKQRLKRYDNERLAFDVNIWTFRGTYQFTKATFARAIVDYNTLNSRVRSQLLLGWTPSPGTSFYVGYNDDMNYNSQNPFTGQLTTGFRRNSRVFFIKMSYLFRKSF
ncbi:MAG: carbohydrate binding family 9 domain-containing protein [Acidobacteriota bacterium]